MLIGLSIFSISLLLVLLTWIYRHSQLRPLPNPKMRTFGSKKAQSTDHIPRVIWTYWHSCDLPEVVLCCIDGWRRLNPDYKVRILNADNISLYIDSIPSNLNRLNVTKQADWIRLELLHRYGGVWMDSSIILTQSLAWVEKAQAESQAEFVGYNIDGYTKEQSYPVIENWFMAAIPNSRFVTEWLQLFRFEAIENDAVDYLNRLKKEGTYNSYAQVIGNPNYHTMHVAGQEVIQRYKEDEAPFRLFLLCAEYSAFWLQVQSKWKRRSLYLRLLVAVGEHIPNLIKLRGGERRKLAPYLQYGLVRKNSIVDNYLRRSGEN